jgi:hypothetical protein
MDQRGNAFLRSVLRAGRGTEGGVMQIVKNPYIIVCGADDGMGTKVQILPPPDFDFRHYGLLVADVIRNVAATFNVPEQAVFDWVKKEMKKPTTKYETESGGDTKQ